MVVGKVGEGITGVRKVLVEKDAVRVHAVFRGVREEWLSRLSRNSLMFCDDCIFECAAYELNRLLKLNRIPPVEGRKVRVTRKSAWAAAVAVRRIAMVRI